MVGRSLILDISEKTDRYNFHTHTQFCDGRASMEEMVNGAISSGLKYLGFSPHSPIPIESKCNMSKAGVSSYIAEISRLKDLYGDKIEIFAGMEVDFLGENWGPSIDYIKNLPLDFRIGSVHFIKNQKGEYVDIDGRPESFIVKMADCFDNDIRYVIERFYAQTLSMIEAGGFDIIGHFDKIGLNASKYAPGIDNERWYVDLVNDTINAIRKAGLIVEINTKHYSAYQRLFPDKRYIKDLISAGIPLIVNSDAHYPELTDASRDVGLSLLDRVV